MKKIHYPIIGGITATLFVLIYVFEFAGLCSITPCEAEIEIISYEIPDEVYVGDKMQAEFTIKNKGEVTAENCVLRWRLGEPEFSKTFSLSPLEEIKIKLLSFEATPSAEIIHIDPQYISLAWVFCDNTESPKLQKFVHVRIP